MRGNQLFDEWPERYNQWFTTPIGKLVKETEQELVNELLDPRSGENILDAGCGTGIFTLSFLSAGARVTGLDISLPMLAYAAESLADHIYYPVRGDMLRLPFKDNAFDKTVSVTALEFIPDGKTAVDELFRVTHPGGCVVVATLNSLSPWAERRRNKDEENVLQDACYHSPRDLLSLSSCYGTSKTVVHFLKDDDPVKALKTEREGQANNLDTGAFVAVKWQKPVE